MIVRILGEGQWQVGEDRLDRLNHLDDELTAAVDRGDEAGFGDALGALLDEIRGQGTPVADDDVRPSELILPHADAGVDEVRAMLRPDGLIPG